MQFLLFTFLYTVIGMLSSRLSDNPQIAIAAYTAYAAALSVYYQKRRKNSIEATDQKQLAAAVPLIAFTIANLTAITTFPDAYIAQLTVCAAIEELLFRGFLYTAMSKHSGVLYTVVSSLVFCIYHGVGGADAIELICSLSFSLALSSYMSRYKRILPCIIAHALTNLTSHSTPSTSILIVCCAVCVIYSAVILKTNIKRKR